VDRPSDPVRICDAALQCVQRGDLNAYVELFADDAVMAFPFAPAGFPRLMRGRDEIVETLAPLWQRASGSGRVITGFDDLRWHEADDGRTVVAEFQMVGQVGRTGGTYGVRYVHVYEIEFARITELRDYWDPSALLHLPS
jgi:hypothetical protein